MSRRRKHCDQDWLFDGKPEATLPDEDEEEAERTTQMKRRDLGLPARTNVGSEYIARRKRIC